MQCNSILLTLAAISFALAGGVSSEVKANDIDLKVGIVQRFGDEEKDQLTINATSEDTLTFRFLDDNKKPQS